MRLRAVIRGEKECRTQGCCRNCDVANQPILTRIHPRKDKQYIVTRKTTINLRIKSPKIRPESPTNTKSDNNREKEHSAHITEHGMLKSQTLKKHQTLKTLQRLYPKPILSTRERRGRIRILQNSTIHNIFYTTLVLYIHSNQCWAGIKNTLQSHPGISLYETFKISLSLIP